MSIAVISDELKSCPFCGGLAHAVSTETDAKKQYYVTCGCGMHTCKYDTPEEAVLSWNRRDSGYNLKPCPFCGGKAVMQKPDDDIYFAECGDNLCAQTPLFPTAYLAGLHWNRRVRQ